MIIEGDVFKIDKTQLAYMIAHKCEYCSYHTAICSEPNGCERGVREGLQNFIDEKTKK